MKASIIVPVVIIILECGTEVIYAREDYALRILNFISEMDE